MRINLAIGSLTNFDCKDLLLGLKKIKPKACGADHHYAKEKNGLPCDSCIRETNSLCTHGEHFAMNHTITFLTQKDTITVDQAYRLEEIINQSRLQLFHRDSSVGFIGTCLKRKSDPDLRTDWLEEMMDAYGMTIRVEELTEPALRSWAIERQREAGMPIEKIRRMLIALLTYTLKPNASKEWTQERANRFLSHLSSTIPESESIAA